jgi:hypothetical protein
MRRAALGLLVITALLSRSQTATAQLSGYEYVANGGFEAGAESWTITGAQLDVVDANTVVPAEGAAAGRIRPNGGAFNLRQTNWSGAPPGDYTMTVSIYATAPAEVRLMVSADPGRNLLEVLLPQVTNAWHHAEAALTLPGDHAVTIAVAVALPPAPLCSSTLCAFSARHRPPQRRRARIRRCQRTRRSRLARPRGRQRPPARQGHPRPSRPPPPPAR